jgi:dUTP pyrophosphatase
MTLDVKIKKLRSGAELPERATPGSAAADLRACIDEPMTIEPGAVAAVPTGLSMSFPADYVALVFARSGLARKNGISLANGVGVIDSDYRGEVAVLVRNGSSEPFTVHDGDRIAQLMFVPVAAAAFAVTDVLDETERAGGGFGSTGISG